MTYLDIPDVQRAADSLVSAAKVLNNAIESKQLFKEACDLIWDGRDDLNDLKISARAHEVFECYFEHLINYELFDEARLMLPLFVKMLKKNEMGASTNKAHLTAAILDMRNGDFVHAQVLLSLCHVW
jgi:hypothetical protein